MNIKNLLNQSVKNLNAITSTPRLDAELLLAYVLQKPRSYFHSHSDQELNSNIIVSFLKLEQQRLTGKPIAYILKHKEFWTLDLEINEHVLIPRPETELLVELALNMLPVNEHLNVADLGTGSGAIALAIAKERPNWLITAVDISSEALLVAQKNADRFNLTNIQFIISDWCLNLPEHKFDAIISNPPYIAENDPYLQGSIKFEPSLALISKNNGLDAIDIIIKQAKSRLNTNGILILEHGCDQGKATETLLATSGYQRITQHQDLAGLDRALCGHAQY